MSAFRSFRFEPLTDGEADDPAADKEPKPARRGMFRVNHAAKLEKALAELHKIEQRRLELIEWDKAEEQAANELLVELGSQIPVASREGDLEVFKKTCKARLAKDLELTPRIEALRQWIGGLSRQSTFASIDDRGNVARLKTEFPQLKTLLVDAVCAKYGQLQEEADCIAKEEQKRLDDAYGVGEYDAKETEVVKRARTNCNYIKLLVERGKTEPVETLYLDITRYLFWQ